MDHFSSAPPPSPLPPPPPARPVPKGLLIVVVAILLGVALVAAAMVLGIAYLVHVESTAPEGAVKPGRQMPVHVKAEIDDLNILEPDETVRYYYADGDFSVREHLCMLTDRRVILYGDDYTEPLTAIPFEAIEAVDAREDAQYYWLTIFVQAADGTEAWLTMYNGSGEAGRFYNALREAIGLPPAEPADYGAYDPAYDDLGEYEDMEVPSESIDTVEPPELSEG